MSHVDEGVLQALLDGEVRGRERKDAERHLGECPACAADLHAARERSEFLSGALAMVDAPAPTRAAYANVVREKGRRTGWGLRDLSRAAILIIGLSTAAYAIPGSPVRGWIDDLLGRLAVTEVPVVDDQAIGEAAPEPAVTGISVLPADGRVQVAIRDAGSGLRVRARLGDGDQAEVLAAGEAANARFQSGPGRIEVVGAASGNLDVVLPRGATEAVVTVDGRVYVYKEGPELRVTTPAVRRDATEIMIEFD
jgi:anti-sigma factor RsiW